MISSGPSSNHPLFYYLHGGLLEMKKRLGIKNSLNVSTKTENVEEIKDRLDYYCKPQETFIPSVDWPSLEEIKLPSKLRTYYFDLLKFSGYFPASHRLQVHFGDNTEQFTKPTLVKTRPIGNENHPNVLMKFNTIRHFNFIKDSTAWKNKKDLLFGRAHISRQKPLRQNFHKLYFEHPLFDIGQINKGTTHDQWIKPKVSIRHHLDYKFILCLEGVDVASNLKWVMSSNSLAVMTKPKFESWFMEDRLIAGEHYVQVQDDFSDVPEQLEYYLARPALCKEISQNAQAYVKKFQNSRLEYLLGLLVLDRYFFLSGQCVSNFPEFQTLP